VSLDTRYQNALQLFNGSQFLAAISVLEELLAQHPKHQASLSLIIKALLNEKRPQEAHNYLPQLKLKKDLATLSSHGRLRGLPGLQGRPGSTGRRNQTTA
jgi:predicted Zn-dependent protease